MICPDCPPARAARALALDEGFWVNLAFVLLPFVVVAAVVGWVYARLDRGDHHA